MLSQTPAIGVGKINVGRKVQPFCRTSLLGRQLLYQLWLIAECGVYIAFFSMSGPLCLLFLLSGRRAWITVDPTGTYVVGSQSRSFLSRGTAMRICLFLVWINISCIFQYRMSLLSYSWTQNYYNFETLASVSDYVRRKSWSFKSFSGEKPFYFALRCFELKQC